MTLKIMENISSNNLTINLWFLSNETERSTLLKITFIFQGIFIHQKYFNEKVKCNLDHKFQSEM